jgi:hypothetical protein
MGLVLQKSNQEAHHTTTTVQGSPRGGHRPVQYSISTLAVGVYAALELRPIAFDRRQPAH